MNKVAHTPGPWHLAEAVEGKFTKTNLRRIRSEQEGLEHGAVCEVYGIADGTEAAANARLIAAAPELLEALEATILPLMRLGDFIGNDDKNGPEWAGRFDRCAIILRARNAITKATGKASEMAMEPTADAIPVVEFFEAAIPIKSESDTIPGLVSNDYAKGWITGWNELRRHFLSLLRNTMPKSTVG
jgi:hypothetical protein